MKTFIIILVVSCCISCKKEIGVAGPQGPAGNTGPNGTNTNDTGSISGKLSLYSEFSSKESDLSGAIVTLSSGNLTMKDTSDVAGAYQFHGLSTGTYNITYEKPGYGTYKVFGISHIPNGIIQTIVQDVSLLEIPVKTAVQNITAIDHYYFSTLIINLDTSSLTYVQYYQNFMILIGKDENVNPNNAVKIYGMANTDGNGNYSYPLDKDNLRVYFQPGESAYVKAATYNRYVFTGVGLDMIDLGPASYYVDPNSGDYVYPNLSVSPNVIKIPL
jgi:hypothetical protein